MARYRYRIEPTAEQQQMLARIFGCVRVVFNDAIRCRDAAHAAGDKISRTEVQRRVITLAKRSPEREWLAQVPSVALVQSVRDSDRAYHNWFDSMSKRRKGRRVGRPRLKSRKDHRQSFRLTRNGFSVRPDGVLLLAKVGPMRVRWSRSLPDVPSSVTILAEPDGHYYAPFVVDREVQPLAVVARESGVDVGLARLATTADTAGGGKDIPNPKYLARKQRKLARLEREKARRLMGSANRAKARRKVAIQHGKVARARRDYHHKQALDLVRENQVIHVEDLNIAGMAINRRLARAIHDAGWAQFVRLIEEKAGHFGRSVQRVSRWLPSSKTCNACGHRMQSMPLQIRQWVCPQCGDVHDRDRNAALNILAAARAERENACGADVRPLAKAAVGDEAGSVRTAAKPHRNPRISVWEARQRLEQPNDLLTDDIEREEA